MSAKVQRLPISKCQLAGWQFVLDLIIAAADGYLECSSSYHSMGIYSKRHLAVVRSVPLNYFC